MFWTNNLNQMLTTNWTSRLVTTSSPSPTQGLVAWWVDHCFLGWPMFFRLTIVFCVFFLQLLTFDLWFCISRLTIVCILQLFYSRSDFWESVVQWQSLKSRSTWKVYHCLYLSTVNPTVLVFYRFLNWYLYLYLYLYLRCEPARGRRWSSCATSSYRTTRCPSISSTGENLFRVQITKTLILMKDTTCRFSLKYDLIFENNNVILYRNWKGFNDILDVYRFSLSNHE